MQEAMKKILLFGFILFYLGKSYSQNIDSLFYYSNDSSYNSADPSSRWRDTILKGDYSAVYKIVLQIKTPYRTIPEIAKAITEPFKTKEDKVRAIFCWMTANISYDCKEYHNESRVIKGPTRKKGASKEVIAGKWEDAFFDYATQVLKARKGVCEGYATLFFELCHCSGIDCEVVRGKAKTITDGKAGWEGHAWNRVLLNDQWMYVDVTWASGTVDSKVTRFTKKLNNFYYLTPMDRPYPDHIDNEKRTRKRNELVGNETE
jgi:transglutaminase/protease-like cytokinesis protein 3